jgi:membrane associated rhomboid family serine protease
VYERGSQMGFGPPVTPQIIKTLLIANGVVFILQHFSDQVTNFGVVSPAAVWDGFQIWRPFTYMWLHSPNSIMHIAFNMLALWMFGSQLALFWGEERFLKFYLTCGVGAGILIATVPWVPVLLGFPEFAGNLGIPTLGASGAVMGVVLAFSLTWPDKTIMLMIPPMPIKAIWLMPIIFAIEFISGPSNVSHVGHLGGVLVGWIYLRREGRTPGIPNLETLKLRWRRYQMRQKIRAVHQEDKRERQRWRDEDHDDKPRYH